MDDPNACVICGSENDSNLHWQTYCSNCAKETWGAAVVAKFIVEIEDLTERLKNCEADRIRLQNKLDPI
jgi:hypothetical protein